MRVGLGAGTGFRGVVGGGRVTLHGVAGEGDAAESRDLGVDAGDAGD